MAAISKALVLGGKRGMLGAALAKALQAKGWEVTALDGSDIDYFSSNLSDVLAEAVDRLAPNCVFNAAGYTDVEKAEQEPEEAAALNRSLPAALGRALRERPARLVHYSTDFVFDGRKKTPYTIDDLPNPISVYGRTKYEGEQAILSLGLARFCIIRTAWLYGFGKKNFVSKILDICREKKNIAVVYDQIGSPTYAADLAKHSVELVELGGNGLFHIVNSGQANWSELASEAVNYLQMECQITPVTAQEFASKVQRPAYSVLDCTSFTQSTSVTPRPWPQALREYLMLEFPDGF
ncbi:MAG: dTDP-4-dehydrorhamnose reductase [Deltaproteobacteria bacterium]|jgi:dTDP-4-dehydrorhamnose reductase|nr:dTDP-4-dehydrorhamnose reductase [Deltaproteobacteria bacterium]